MQSLIDAACEAEEKIPLDELEEFANVWRTARKTVWHAGHIGDGEHRREVVFDANHGQVAEIIDRDQEGEAVARLIAASPVLLEACQAIAALSDGQGQANLMEVAGRARRAISMCNS